MKLGSAREYRALLLALLLPVLITACLRSGPEALVEKYFSAINKGEIEEAIALFSQRTRDQTSREKMKAGLSLHAQQVKAAGGIDHLEVISADTTDTSGSVKVEIVMGNGNKGVQDIAVVYEDGAWRLGNN